MLPKRSNSNSTPLLRRTSTIVMKSPIPTLRESDTSMNSSNTRSNKRKFGLAATFNFRKKKQIDYNPAIMLEEP